MTKQFHHAPKGCFLRLLSTVLNFLIRLVTIHPPLAVEVSKVKPAAIRELLVCPNDCAMSRVDNKLRGSSTSDIEQTGMYVDIEKYKQLGFELDQVLYSAVAGAKKVMGGRLVAKHEDPDKPGGMNITKASMLTDFMFSPMGLNLKPKMFTPKPDKQGVKKPSTSLEHIMMFEDVPAAQEFVGYLKTYSQAAKAKNTYVGVDDGSHDNGFLSCLAGDRRFHPNFFLFTGDKEEDEGGAVTGRTSAKNPAIQTVPSHHPWAKRIKECYIAPPGMKIAGCDFSQGELRVAACVANEETMIASYKKDMDLHTDTAAFCEGMTYEALTALDKLNHDQYEEIRQKGKAGNQIHNSEVNCHEQ